VTTIGYNKASVAVRLLWEILKEMKEEEKEEFLLFATGCSRPPILVCLLENNKWRIGISRLKPEILYPMS